MMRNWDKDGSGGLQWIELHALLKDMAVKHGHTEYSPADEDIKWVIKKATKGTDKHDFSWSLWRNGTQQLARSDLRRGMPEYLDYLSHLDVIEEVFKDFNAGQDGHLVRDELERLLTQLNDGYPPSDLQLDEVIAEADEIKDGTVTKLELRRAIAVWYAGDLPSDAKERALHGKGLEQYGARQFEHQQADKGMRRLADGAQSSACCVVQ